MKNKKGFYKNKKYIKKNLRSNKNCFINRSFISKNTSFPIENVKEKEIFFKEVDSKHLRNQKIDQILLHFFV